jgi:hypothetical protein
MYESVQQWLRSQKQTSIYCKTTFGVAHRFQSIRFVLLKFVAKIRFIEPTRIYTFVIPDSDK